MEYSEERKKKSLTQKQRQHLSLIAKARGYRPPSQKGLKRATVWNKGIKAVQFQGENHGQWKGEQASYVSIHSWVRRWKGQPVQCENCGKVKTTRCSIQWANKDHSYKRVLEDYIALCVKCHHALDRTNNGYTR